MVVKLVDLSVSFGSRGGQVHGQELTNLGYFSIIVDLGEKLRYCV